MFSPARQCLAVLLVPLVLGGCSFERMMNRVDPGPDRPASAAAVAVHQKSFVVDMHADSLLWSRDLSERADFAHVDVPRLRDGGIDLQIFSMPTQTPWGLNFVSNKGDSDMLTLASAVKMWPVRTWNSPFERARYMAQKLEALSTEPGSKVRLIRTREDLDPALASAGANDAAVNVMLSVEGAHTWGTSLADFRTLYLDGLRMAGLAHFFDNEVGGSAQGENKGGLTAYGRQWIKEAEQIGVTLDLAHSSEKLIKDVLAVATKPLVFSHTGVIGVCDNTRNISDDTIRKIAANGGVIGLAYFEPAICERTVEQIVASILHVVKLVGPEHAGLGSDFDGAVATPFDTTGVPRITEELLAAGLSEADVRLILGGNVVRVLQNNLPTEAQFAVVAAQIAAAERSASNRK